ncbi:hypothetical protein ACFYMO_03910 [Streptomyces sp. NPDC007025]|uniref:hypothetical protein n=1 Tax=Streptomyces sp. NPDC007025 TaxID=3364771 RepID=UPI0036B10573
MASKGRGRSNRGNRGNAAALKQYWGPGKGGTTKIRWNTPSDFTRCKRHLKRYLGSRAAGYCARLHREMTGVWPGDRRNVGRTSARRRR